ncbi:MAG: hypothetical protein AABY64_09030 [Bdellovibrionota bacterium]
MLINNIKEQNQLFSKFLRPIAIILLYMSVQRWIFELVAGLNVRRPISGTEYSQIYLMGFRFDLLVWALIFAPLFLLIFLKLKMKNRIFVTQIYFAICWLIISAINFVNLPYFALYQKHLNKPEWSSLNVFKLFSDWMDGRNLFFKSAVLIFILLITWRGFLEIYRVGVRFASQANAPQDLTLNPRGLGKEVLQLFFVFILVAFCARGTLEAHHLRREDSSISPYSEWNELVLNPQWSFNKDDR